VWRSTTHVGVGKATVTSPNGYIETYIVARFSPPGNYVGEYTSEVKPRKLNGKYIQI